MKKIFVLIALSLAIAFPALAGQSPQGVNNAVNQSGYYTPEKLDNQGNLLVNGDGWLSALNISAATVVKAVSGAVVRVIVNVAGSAPGNIYDANTTGGNTAANLISTIPNTVGIYYLNFPVVSGILISPGASQVVSVSYE